MQLEPLDGRGPLYRQLYRALRRRHPRRARASGHAAAVDARPSRTRPASPAIVSCWRTRSSLDEGYAVGRVGSGTYVASELPGPNGARAVRALGARRRRRRRGSSRGRAASAWRAAPRGPRRKPALRYDFSCGRPSWRDFPHAVWARLVRRRRARLARAADLDYAPSAGLPELRDAIAEHLDPLARRRLHARAGDRHERLAAGARHRRRSPARARRRAWRSRSRTTRVRGRRSRRRAPRSCRSASTRRASTSRVSRRRRRRPRVVYVTPAHQFPTGAVLPLARRLALLAWARRTDAYVVEDDYDSEYRYAGAPIEIAARSRSRRPRVLRRQLLEDPLAGAAARLSRRAARAGARRSRSPGRPPISARRARPTRARRLHRRGPSRGASSALAPPSRGSARRAARGDRRASRRDACGYTAARPACTSCSSRATRPPARSSVSSGGPRAHGVGVYSTTGLYLRRPRRSALLLGHGALSEGEIRTGIGRLAEVMTR